MKIYHGLDHEFRITNPVVTAGTFDGVHIGHRKIINRLNELSTIIHGESVVLTFEPHPRLVIFPDDNQLKLLNTLEEKIKLLESVGVQHLIVIPFTRDFSRLSAKEYVQTILIDKLHLRKLVIGYDHQFGRNREGSIEELKKMAPELNFEVEEIPPQDIDAVKVSSTKIREALKNGDIYQANTFLTYPYNIKGIVVHGNKRGREIGFPTANLSVTDHLKLVPADGVYAVKVELNNKFYDGMLNIGFRPTLDGKSHEIEVHIFDFNEEIYSKELKVQFISKIRQEFKFNNIDELSEQLIKDAIMAKQLLEISS